MLSETLAQKRGTGQSQVSPHLSRDKKPSSACIGSFDTATPPLNSRSKLACLGEWVIDLMNGTAATAKQPANDRHVLALLKTVLAKFVLEGTPQVPAFLLHNRSARRGGFLHPPLLGRPRR